MKKIFLFLLLAVLTVVSADARVYALITGVSNYYGPERGNLHQSTKDAKRFKELMELQTKDITILTSQHVTRQNVLEKLRAICNRAQKGDRIVFFYSGHGAPGSLCGVDGHIPYSDIVNLLSKSNASEKICFIDACFAGTMADAKKAADLDKDMVKAITGSKDMALFLSCREEEKSIENPLLGAGFFTQALLKGLRGKSDANHDKEITVKELFDYIYGDVVKRSQERQHPQLIAPKEMFNRVLFNWNTSKK